jgi:hypothetical protein
MKFINICISAFFLVSVSAGVASAQESGSSGNYHPFLSDNFHIGLGAYRPSKNFGIGADPSDGGSPGESIDASDSQSTGLLNFHWRFTKNWSFQGTYWNTDSESEQILTENFEFQDQVFLALGEASLKDKLSPMLEEIGSKADFALRYAKSVHDPYIQHFITALTNINNALNTQAERNNQEYIANSEALLTELKTQQEAISAHWSPFVTAAIEERGFLEDEGVKKEYDKMLLSIQSTATETIEQIKTESKAAIEEAKKLASDIETKARKTATGISIIYDRVCFYQRALQLETSRKWFGASTTCVIERVRWIRFS